ncbi:hypothetical protein GCM10010196_14190 [Agromyces mediolanus]|uniref:Uncharacterized protein n=1 Tax=Agromyces mediolanus TaxID=41986 RepID=A0A918CGL0_AGRME|nr:hypothetical protein GCM10010196_14190 [Agromyces mediolanus]
MTRAIGSTNQNMNRQERKFSTRPEMVGPMAGATDITIETRPMKRPRSLGATTVMSVVMSSGIMIAVPVACTMRPPRSTSKPGAVAAISVPAENNDMAVMNIERVGKRCSRKPVIGMTTAIVSMNAVVSHCAADSEMCRSSTRCGMATPMIVSLRKTTKVAPSSSQMTLVSRAPCSGWAARMAASSAAAAGESARAASAAAAVEAESARPADGAG